MCSSDLDDFEAVRTPCADSHKGSLCCRKPSYQCFLLCYRFAAPGHCRLWYLLYRSGQMDGVGNSGRYGSCRIPGSVLHGLDRGQGRDLERSIGRVYSVVIKLRS